MSTLLASPSYNIGGLGGPRFIVGTTGGTKFSFDAITWNTNVVTEFGANNVTKLARTQNGTYICLLSSGTIWTSRDSMSWAQVTHSAVTSQTGNWTAIGAVDTDNLCLYRGTYSAFDFILSTDRGATWTSQYNAILDGLPGSGNGGRTWPNKCVFDNNIALVCGYNSSNVGGFVAATRSTNGSTWSPTSGMYTGGGGYNPQLPGWSHGGVWYCNMISNDGGWHAAAYKSTDNGINWSGISGISWGLSDEYLAKGKTDGSVTLWQSGAGLLRSTDGSSFSGVTHSMGTLNGMAFGNSLFATNGGGSVYSSPDGSTWTSRVGSVTSNVIFTPT